MSLSVPSAEADVEGTPRPNGALARHVAVAGVVALVVAGVLAASFTGYGPNDQDLSQALARPSSEHWVGTDRLGRDQLTRLLFGLRTSILASLLAVGIGVALGAPAGLLAGWMRGTVDRILSLVFDSIMTIPGIILALAVIAGTGPGLYNAMAAVGVVLAPRLYRVQRAATIEVAGESFVEALKATGCPRARLLFAHVLPNSVQPLLVQVSIALGTAVLVESSLSFVGLGARPPQSSLGAMLSEAYARLDTAPHLIYPPGIVLILLVLMFSLVGDLLARQLR